MKKMMIATILAFFAFSAVAGAADKKVIIGFKKEARTTEEHKIQKLHRTGGHLKRHHKMINAISAQIPEEEIEKLKRDPAIAYVEPDITVGLTEPLITTPLSQEYSDSWGVTKIGGTTAAAAGLTGAGIKVAVLDSGIDYSHPDLKDNYKGGYNFIYDNNDPFDDGYISHGTHIAGIIGARNNGTGVVGVAPEVSLYAVKVLGGMVTGDLSDILAGMEWAITNKMDIINMSIGAPIDSAAFKDACDRAYQAGIILIASSGNTHGAVEFPAAYDSVIAVSATDQDDTIATFSNYGETIELTAPGVNINSTLRGGSYGIMKGTSQATAHVTGAAAILLSKQIADNNGDGRTADDVRTLLGTSATDLGAIGRDQFFGFGRVDLDKALTPPAATTLEYSIAIGQLAPLKQTLKVPLDTGAYKVEITTRQLDLRIAVMDSNGTRLIESERRSRINNKRSQVEPDTSLFTVNIGAEGTLIFFPHGKPGATASIRITPVQ